MIYEEEFSMLTNIPEVKPGIVAASRDHFIVFLENPWA